MKLIDNVRTDNYSENAFDHFGSNEAFKIDIVLKAFLEMSLSRFMSQFIFFECNCVKQAKIFFLNCCYISRRLAHSIEAFIEFQKKNSTMKQNRQQTH